MQWKPDVPTPNPRPLNHETAVSETLLLMCCGLLYMQELNGVHPNARVIDLLGWQLPLVSVYVQTCTLNEPTALHKADVQVPFSREVESPAQRASDQVSCSLPLILHSPPIAISVLVMACSAHGGKHIDTIRLIWGSPYKVQTHTD